jgi:hypothetical protein
MNNYSSFGFGYDSQSEHDIAQICLNGHIVNDAVKRFPQFSSKFCRKCGQPTIEKCPACNMPIKGRYHAPGTAKESPLPLYCHDCGKPYPWTRSIIDTAIELISEEDDLTEEEKGKISSSLVDIISHTPRTPLAAIRVKKVFDKMSDTGKEGFKQLLSQITTESAQRIIWNP